MKTELTLNVLQTMNAQEYEDNASPSTENRRADGSIMDSALY